MLHLGVEVGVHLDDAARDLRADLHFFQRLDRASRLHLLEDVALLQLLGGEARRWWGLRVAAPGEDTPAGGSEHQDDREPPQPAPGALRPELPLEVAHGIGHDARLRSVR